MTELWNIEKKSKKLIEMPMTYESWKQEKKEEGSYECKNIQWNKGI